MARKIPFIHSLSEYLLIIYYVPDTAIGAEDKTVRAFMHMLFTFWGREADNKQTNQLNKENKRVLDSS